MSAKKNQKLSDLGYPIYVPKNKTNLKERCRILRKGIRSGKYRGKKLERAEMNLNWYQKELQELIAG